MNDPKDRYPSQQIETDLSLDTTSDFQSDLDDVIDIDQDFDAEEEGIFEPKQGKRKSSSKMLLGVLILLILAGGGGYLYLTSAEDLAPNPAPPPVPVLAQTDQSVLPEVDTTLAQNQTGDLQPLPQPVSDFASDAPASAIPPVPSEQPSEKTEASASPENTPATPSENETLSVPPAQTPQPELSLPSTPAATELSGGNADTALPVVPGAPPSDTDITENNMEVLPPSEGPLTPEPVLDAHSQGPDQATLGIPPQLLPQSKASLPNTPVQKPADDMKSARQVVNIEVDKKGGLVQKEYFDSPEGKSLKNFAPPPSINPFGEPGENIIIVRKTVDDGMVVEKGEDNGIVESKLVSANRAMALGKYDAALNFYNEIRKKNQSDPRILMGRAVALQKLGEKEQAIDAYNELLDVDPQNPEAITNLMGLVSKSQPARALEGLLELREKYPRNPAVAAQLGVAYAQSGNPQDGLRYLEMASKLQPENPLHFFNMAVLAEQMNKNSDAILFYEKALDTSSIYPEEAAKTGFSRDQVYDRLSRLRGQ